MDNQTDEFNGERNYKYAHTPSRGVAHLNVQLSKHDESITILNKDRMKQSNGRAVEKKENQNDRSFDKLDSAKYNMILDPDSNN